MKIGIQSARIIDPKSSHHNKTANLIIENGVLVSIGSESIDQADQQITGNDLVIYPGFFDPFVQFWDPGHEFREDINSGAAAAAHGGFTQVGLMPNTNPFVTSKAQIDYLQRNNHKQVTQLLPFGAVTSEKNSAAITEMMDMHQAGAIGFSLGSNCVEDAGVVMRTLQYLLPIQGVFVQFPNSSSLAGGGWMNEGIPAVRMGVKGIPNIAESIIVQRDLRILEYTGSRLHFSQISTAESVALIRDAKKKGHQVSASVSPWHLYFTDEDVVGYQTDYKLQPPLRSDTDREALRQGVKDGTIDFVSSFHMPFHNDEKEIEFGLAKYGSQGLESVFQMFYDNETNLFAEEDIYKLLVSKSREIFGLEVPTIQENKSACLSCFDVSAERREVTEQDFVSKSKRNPMLGHETSCFPKCIINEQQYQVF